MLPKQIVSGGQTGVDRAALDAAIASGVPHGGWCPQGRRAEDGEIDARYQLQETSTSAYPQRTEKNVVDSDGTLILYCRTISGGTELTARLAERHGRPVLLIDLRDTSDTTSKVVQLKQWLEQHMVAKLNIAGPRESTSPGVSQLAASFLEQALQAMAEE